MTSLPRTFQFMISITILSSMGVGSAVNAGGQRSVPVQVAEAEIVELSPGIWIAGTIISRHDAKISSEVEGRIKSLLEVGDEVEKGDVIASIDDTTIRMQLDEARTGVTPVEAKLKFLNAEVERLNKLAKENNTAKNRLDEMISDRDAMHGELMMKQTRLAQAKDTLQRSIILAPFPGVVVERFRKEGEWAKTGDNLIRLVDTETKEVQGRIQQKSAMFIKKGDMIEVADDQKRVMATVRTLVPVGDAVSRLYEARLDYQQAAWMPGHAVRIRVPTAEPQKVLVVPQDALVIRGKVIKVFRILENNTAEAVLVKTGIADDQLIEVIGNINQGDRIVVLGNERLRPRQQVVIQEEQ